MLEQKRIIKEAYYRKAKKPKSHEARIENAIQALGTSLLSSYIEGINEAFSTIAKNNNWKYDRIE